MNAKATLWTAACLTLALAIPCFGQKAPAYGYLLSDDAANSLWWAEGAYKVMKDDPVPKAKGTKVVLSAAANEYEPFLLVLRPKTRLDQVRAASSGLRRSDGMEIKATDVSLCHVGYVPVTVPTDADGKAGLWPDPLPPVNGPFTAYPGENHPLWITVHVPAGTKPGLYAGTVTLSSPTWKKDIPVEVRVWNFELPEKSSIRSSFGLAAGPIKAYHNLETEEDAEKVIDLYFQNMKEHRVCPRSPFELYPLTVTVTGVYWEGGEFVSEPVHGGRRALKIVDAETDKNVEARSTEKIAVDPGLSYELTWFVRTDEENQPYTVLVEAFNTEGQWLASQNVLRVFQGGKEWKAEKIELKGLSPEVSTLTLRLFPAFRTAKGDTTGTAYFDDMVLAAAPSPAIPHPANLLHGGDFEMSLDEMKVETDFTEFDRAAKRYLDEFGFNSFDLSLQGLGSGSFFSHQEGTLAGFRQGTPEYDRLLSQYLGQVQDHLEKNGWLGREYIYWFDEPDEKDYPFVRAGMTNIRKNASKLTRFITEHKPGPGIMDVSEISCTIFHRMDPKVVAELAPQGREFWSYLCTRPKSPWVTLFIDHPAINMRMWLWMSFKFGLKGILVWESDYWDGYSLFPTGTLQNPWADPMSYTSGYGEPFGQVNDWGNGDGRFLYPPNRDPNKDKTKYLCGPINSIRWEILREGIEDYEYFVLLRDAAKKAGPEKKALADEAGRLLDFPESIFKSGQDYTKDPKVLLEYRRKIAALIEALTGEQH